MKNLFEQSLSLLKGLIEIPSFSKEEVQVANYLNTFFTQKGIQVERFGNNIIVQNKHFDPDRPSILLNSHIDTVKPIKSWTKDPFNPEVEGGQLFGLGSNDAGASLVSLLGAFLHFYEEDNLKYNLVFAATAEEEISGKNGIESILPSLPDIIFGIVGEPTQMRMAVAEKGLMVLDCLAKGVSGHAARNEGENAIYNALDDIGWFQEFRFPKESEILGPIKMNVTLIQAGTQHNVIPDECKFVVDVRTTDVYTNEETLRLIDKYVKCDVVARSTRLQASGLPQDHFIFDVAEELEIETFGSPTLSDQALMPFYTVKIGPGDSARSHTANEFIKLKEIEEGIAGYIKILKSILIEETANHLDN